MKKKKTANRVQRETISGRRPEILLSFSARTLDFWREKKKTPD